MLTEMALGPWEGLSESEIARRFPVEYEVWNTTPDCLKLAGREMLDEVGERILGAMRLGFNSESTVLLVTHVALIRVGILRYTHRPLREYKSLSVGNCDCWAFHSTGHVGVAFRSSECSGASQH